MKVIPNSWSEYVGSWYDSITDFIFKKKYPDMADLEENYFASQRENIRQEGEIEELRQANSESDAKRVELEQIVDEQGTLIGDVVDQLDVERTKAEFDVNQAANETRIAQQEARDLKRIVSEREATYNAVEKRLVWWREKLKKSGKLELLMEKAEIVDPDRLENVIVLLNTELNDMAVSNRNLRKQTREKEEKERYVSWAGSKNADKLYLRSADKLEEDYISCFKTEISSVGRYVMNLLRVRKSDIDGGINIYDLLTEESSKKMKEHVELVEQGWIKEVDSYYEFRRKDGKLVHAKVSISKSKYKGQPIQLMFCPNEPIKASWFKKHAGTKIYHKISPDLDEGNFRESADYRKLLGFFVADRGNVILDFDEVNSIPESMMDILKGLCKRYEGNVHFINTDQEIDVYDQMVKDGISYDNLCFRKIPIPKKKVKGKNYEAVPLLQGDW